MSKCPAKIERSSKKNWFKQLRQLRNLGSINSSVKFSCLQQRIDSTGIASPCCLKEK